MLLKEKIKELSSQWKVEEIVWGRLPYKRPRIAGCNARLGVHGWGGDVDIARIRIAGVWGFGWCPISQQRAQNLIGTSVSTMFGEDGMLKEEYYGIEFPLLDWLGNMFHQSVAQLVARELPDQEKGYAVPVYDTTIYFDELHIKDDKEAVQFICSEVQEGLDRGHQHFKVKIGRPGMWMDTEPGLKRDIDIILNIRALIGNQGKIMVDANNGYNLNLTRRFLKETASANLYWMEEAFHEDDQLYRVLRQWMKEEQINTLIADGEGDASRAIVDWAKRGLIDIIQYDLRGYGFFRWMKLARELEPHGVLVAPHNYGGFYGNYALVQFAPSVGNHTIAEWDQADAEGIDTSAYVIQNGSITLPKADGFGLRLDEDVFNRYAEKNGWKVTL